jgi:hypothetical protein
MHMTQFFAGTAVLAGVLSLAVGAVVPPPVAPPIVIHSIAYADGEVTQDRTVSSEGSYTAAWTAEVRDFDTGYLVPGCQGSGVWPYPPGHKVVKMSLAEWVGSSQCRLPPGAYQLVATYFAGTFETLSRSERFVVE